MLTAKQLGRQLMTVLFLGMISIATFYIFSNYYSTKNTLESDALDKLHAIARTTSLHIDGDMHSALTSSLSKKSDSTLILSNDAYKNINSVLTDIKEINKLNTDIYTLFLDSVTSSNNIKIIKLGVISGAKQYYRHEYNSHPKELINKFTKGGVLEEYVDEHGTWLSAFSPIKNSKGETIAVVQVDQKIDEFLIRVWEEAIWHALISLFIISVVSLIMIIFIQKMIKSDKRKTETIEITSKLLAAQNLKVTNSISYAQRIQNSIIPKERDLKHHFHNSFIYNTPKDIVSGDFPWIHKCNNNVYFAALDCTGHGVPGAMVSIVGYFLLEKIMHQKPDLDSIDILSELHRHVTVALKQDKSQNHNNDGMDAALCKIDMNTLSLCFSGAHRSLYLIRDSKLEEFKGARRGIGGLHYEGTKRKYHKYDIQLQKGDRLFVFSDGYADQFGGENLKKLGPKKLREILSANSPMEDIRRKLSSEHLSWKVNTEQTDDILIIGVEI